MDAALRGGYYRPSALEVATTLVTGRIPYRVDTLGSVVPPLRALEDVIRRALLNGPCVVTFSGGRDSSAVLAVAVDLARREGLPEPVAFTNVYPGMSETQEDDWQHAVIDHLKVSEWVRYPCSPDNELLSDTALDGLRKRGLIWPPTLQLGMAAYEYARGGSLLNGEGGDEVLGARRITPLVRMARRHDFRKRAALISSTKALVPNPVRAALLRRDLGRAVELPWVRRSAREALIDSLCRDMAPEPLRWDAATRHLLGRRAPGIMQHAYELVAAEHGVALHQPLLDERFILALATYGGRWGFTSRNDLTTRLFEHLLPHTVLNRTSKASFNRAFFGRRCREFVSTWDGAGVDPDMVDADVLREEWLSDRPSGLTYTALHSAWLASEGLAARPEREIA